MSSSQTERAEIIGALTTSMRQTMVETVLLFETPGSAHRHQCHRYAVPQHPRF